MGCYQFSHLKAIETPGTCSVLLCKETPLSWWTVLGVVRCEVEHLVCIHSTSLLKIWCVSTFGPLFLALSWSVFHFLPVWLFLFSILLHYNKINVFCLFLFPLFHSYSTSWFFFLLFCTWMFSSKIFVFPIFPAKFPFLSDVFLHSPLSTSLYLSFLYPPHFS